MLMCWHRWTKWVRFSEEYPAFSGAYPVIRADGTQATRYTLREKRECVKCGANQNRLVAQEVG